MAETIVPTTHSVDDSGGGTVTDPANAYDGNAATFANIICNTALQVASETVNGFGADAEPSNRGSVTVRVRLSAVAWNDDNDRGYVHFRPSVTADWVNLKIYTRSDVPESATWVEFDVTPYVGDFVSTGFQVAVQFAKAIFDQPDFPEDPA